MSSGRTHSSNCFVDDMEIALRRMASVTGFRLSPTMP